VRGELVKVPHEDALELGLVLVALVRLARLGEDAARGGERVQGRVSGDLSLPQVTAVTGDLVQRDESAEDHALVVGPGDSLVVGAPGGEAVVDQAAGADHAAPAQPSPLP
jgi:hypothetical protein